MLLPIPDVLTPDEVAQFREVLSRVDWGDGRVTAGAQAAQVKNNQQITEDHPVARELGEVILRKLARNALFTSAALPLKVFPPLFNSYGEGQTFGTHVDAAVRIQRGTDFRIRSDLSATLFLEDPDAYDGGELVIEGQFGTSPVKLPAGHMVLYPSSSLHSVSPVTRGRRVSSFFWMQSMVRDQQARNILFDLDGGIQSVAARSGHDDPAVIQLTGVYHNLLRQWADC